MTPCQTINNLEENIFIAGNRQILNFECFDDDGIALSLESSTVSLKMSPFGNPSYTVLTKSGDVYGGNKFTVVFEDVDTFNLRGIYVIQPIIQDFQGRTFRPAQGIIQIQEAIK